MQADHRTNYLELSERQRVAIARALVTQPSLWLLAERAPTGTPSDTDRRPLVF